MLFSFTALLPNFFIIGRESFILVRISFFTAAHTSPTCCLVAAKRKAESLVSYDLYFAASDVPVSPSDFGGKKKTNDFFKERVR